MKGIFLPLPFSVCPLWARNLSTKNGRGITMPVVYPGMNNSTEYDHPKPCSTIGSSPLFL